MIVTFLAAWWKRLVVSIVLCSAIGCLAAAQQSIFSAKMDDFTHSLVSQLSAKVPAGSAIAIADFDNKDATPGDPNLGFAVSEILTQDFQRSGNFLVLEKKQLEQILKTMELQLTGLYDSDKAAAIGKLINAQLLVVGSITKTAGFYRVSVRVVQVETGAILISDAVDLDAGLLENAAEKYLPPRYRIFLGSSMGWFATTQNGLGTYSIGLALGGSYQIARDQWLSLQGIFYFWNYGRNDSEQTGDLNSGGTFKSGTYSLVDTAVGLVEYGYRLPLSAAISFQPSIGVGAVVGGLNATDEYASWPAHSTSYVPAVSTTSSVWASPAAQVRLDFVFLENSPISFYIGTGYFAYARELPEANLNKNIFLNGFKLEGALMVYF